MAKKGFLSFPPKINFPSSKNTILEHIPNALSASTIFIMDIIKYLKRTHEILKDSVISLNNKISGLYIFFTQATCEAKFLLTKKPTLLQNSVKGI